MEGSLRSETLRTVRRWRLEPGMTIALVMDANANVYVVEACPVGSHFWTIDEAEALVSGSRSGRIIREATMLGRRLLHRGIATRLPRERALPSVRAQVPPELAMLPRPVRRGRRAAAFRFGA